jgi:hypothetical protein
MRIPLCSVAIAVLSATTFSAPVLWEGNGHYYELISGNINWDDARTAAETLVFQGLRGHLATLTSAEENAFVAGTLAVGESGRFAWVGGREPLDDGVWIWDAGPEAGRQFSQRGAATGPDFFVNWGGIEPNDNQADEDYLMLNLGNSFAGIERGQWGDAIRVPNPNDPVLGYIVEYETERGPELQIRRTENGVEIFFYGLLGRRHQLQAAAEFPAELPWLTIGTPVIGAGATIVIPDAPGNENRFYRVEVLQ